MVKTLTFTLLAMIYFSMIINTQSALLKGTSEKSNLQTKQAKEWSGVKYTEDAKAKTRTITGLPKGKEAEFKKLGFDLKKVFKYGPKGSKCARDFECEFIHHKCSGGKCN